MNSKNKEKESENKRKKTPDSLSSYLFLLSLTRAKPSDSFTLNSSYFPLQTTRAKPPDSFKTLKLFLVFPCRLRGQDAARVGQSRGLAHDSSAGQRNVRAAHAASRVHPHSREQQRL